MQFSCEIADDVIRCELKPDRDLKAPVLCVSGMAPMTVTKGGTHIDDCGGYAEFQLPDLSSGTGHKITLAYHGFRPANRAWMPIGAYLRVGEELLELPVERAGARPHSFDEVAPYEGLRLIPQPHSWTLDGNFLTVTRFVIEDEAFAAVDQLAKRQGLDGFLADAGVPISIEPEDLPTDAYRLTARADGISVAASGYGGRFYAAITLLMLLRTHAGRIPCGDILDIPDFNWRGQHFDCARHFYTVDTIFDLLDLMALLKLNRFHWHFADDEAFRLEVDCLPELWQKTRLRGEGQLVPSVFAGASVSGGSYSKADVKRIIARAEALNIEVLPEIEVPAHALALARVYPDVRDPDDTGMEASVQGYRENVLNPAMPRTWEVLEALAEEVADLFPFGHIHLGCDELPENTWMGSPKAKGLMATEGLATTDDLQGWTMFKLASHLASRGVRPAAWEEAARGSNGGIGNNAILFSWTGQGPGLDAARRGYNVVMTPAQHVYLDMAQTADPDDWGANWAAYVDLADTINWQPVPEDEPELRDRILGVQGCFWSEFTTEDSQLWPMLMPRLLGVASKAWNAGWTDAPALEQIAGHFMRHLSLG